MKKQIFVILIVAILSSFGFNHALATTSTIVINEVEANPAGTDGGAEVVELFNPSDMPVDVSGWSVSSTVGRTATVTIGSGSTIPAGGYLIVDRASQWIDNEGEVMELRDDSGALVDSAGPFSDDDNDHATWQRSPDGTDNWVFNSATLGSANFGTFTPDPKDNPSPPSTEPEPMLEPEPTPESETSPGIGTAISFPNQTLTIAFIDVGQGDSALVIFPNSKTMLIDGGERDSSDEVITAIRDQGLSRLDVIVATHPHADHIGGLIDVINSDITVGQVLDSGQLHTTQTFEDLLDAIEAKQIPLESVSEGDTIDIDPSVRLEVLNPRDPFASGIEDEINNNSVVIKLTFGEFSALFAGDMEEYNEQRLSADPESLDVDVLKAGHHGSRYSSIAPFLQAVSPEVVVISAGADNTYGHPHQEALDRMEESDAQYILRTDVDGTITLSSDGSDSYSIVTERTNKAVVVPEFGVTIVISAIALSAIIAYRTMLASRWKR